MTDGSAEGTARRAARPKDRRAQILDSAERLARRGGYNGFSFRDVAAEVGVKSASIHYHFPTKADLAVALTERYGDRFIEALGPPGVPGAHLRLIGAFRKAVEGEDKMCLCGVFGAERACLPEPLADPVAAFFSRLAAWASEGLDEAEGQTAGGEALVAGLQGALLTARATNDPALFDRVAARLLETAKGRPWAQMKEAGDIAEMVAEDTVRRS